MKKFTTKIFSKKQKTVLMWWQRCRPLPVGEKGRATVGKNKESLERIARESTMFLTAKPTSAASGRRSEEDFGDVVGWVRTECEQTDVNDKRTYVRTNKGTTTIL